MGLGARDSWAAGPEKRVCVGATGPSVDAFCPGAQRNDTKRDKERAGGAMRPGSGEIRFQG